MTRARRRLARSSVPLRELVGAVVVVFGCSGADSGSPANGGGGAGGTGTAGSSSAGMPASSGGSPSGTSGAPAAGASVQGGVAGSAGGAGGAVSAAGAEQAGSAGVSGASGASSGGGPSHAVDAQFCTTELGSAATQFAGFRGAYTNPMQIPRSAKNGSVSLVSPSDWTSGFVAGSYWYLYQYTRDQSWRTAAEAWTQALEGQRLTTNTHDVGFIIHSSYGNGYRLTQNAAYVAVITRAAQSLAGRFNPTVGAIRSWDFAGPWTYPVIIDNMMNLELLYRATKLGGGASYAATAVTHALTTQANHFRTDFSSYHVVDYDPANGRVISKRTNQGLNDESAWARGQAWGLYGYTMSYRETQDARFLEQAQHIADFYTQSTRMPADCVPYFDFDAPIDANVPDLRDASAGAIAASALLELAGFAPASAAERYRTFAVCAIRTLSSATYRAAAGMNSQFLLMHSVGNYPIQGEVDVAINYADYYYLEGLTRCAELD